MEKLSIFLSHLTVESKLADTLKGHLSHDFIGLVDVFVSSDRTSIPAGAKWLSEVNSALRTASIHMVLCSCESISRPWIQFEAGAAQIRGIPVVPICHSGLTPAQLPVPLSEWEGIEAATPDGIRKVYEYVAAILGSGIPDVDFELYAKEVASFEHEYHAQCAATAMEASSVQPNIEIIRNPRVVCVSSPQFLKLGFQNQLEIVLEAFPANIKHERVFTSRDLRELLSNGRFDIVHIAAFVCPRTGALIFSDVTLETGESNSSEVDLMSADALASLLKMASTQLVVITSCESFALAVILLGVTNVVATRDMVSPKMMATWVENFYRVLVTQPLSKALDYAINASRAPMRYYGRYSKPSDMLFTVEREKAITVEP